MLLVRTRIGPSPIHGTGLFAAERIPAGTAVWRFTPGFDLNLDPALVDAQPPPFREVLRHYGYVDARLGRYILCCDDARFINHSAAPNIETRYDDPHGVDVATGDIEIGEELTIDYRVLEGAGTFDEQAV